MGLVLMFWLVCVWGSVLMWWKKEGLSLPPDEKGPFHCSLSIGPDKGTQRWCSSCQGVYMSLG